MSRLVARPGNEIVSSLPYTSRIPIFTSRAAIPAAMAIDGAVVLLRIGTNLTQVVYDASRGLWVGAETYDVITNGPPANPVDGDIWHASLGNGVVWDFRYNAGSASAYKWEFIGGPFVFSTIDTQQTANFNNTWGDLGGPTYTVARGGDYEVACVASGLSGAASDSLYTGIAIGSTTPLTTATNGAPGSNWVSLSTMAYIQNVAAGAQFIQRYSAGNQTTAFQQRKLSVIPVRVS